MPRKLRVEYPGAVYHVISRGNYRKDLFTMAGSGKAFQNALFETVERCGWDLLAYVIMSNHYHLAIRTPEPNLVDGMKWLQSTFATRFNRFTGERGHVFQGRYKSLLLTEENSMQSLVDYIHLNPVRARMVPLKNLENHELGSFAKFWHNEKGCRGLDRRGLLKGIGAANSRKGMERYREHLGLLEESDPRKRAEMFKRYCRGWFIGTNEAKREITKDLTDQNPEVHWEGAAQISLNEARWESVVREELKRAGKSKKDIANEKKGAHWKVRIAKRLRKETTVKNPWIAQRLNMGHPNHVSLLVNR
jgi:REP element-mobilizing transposase RayT